MQAFGTSPASARANPEPFPVTRAVRQKSVPLLLISVSDNKALQKEALGLAQSFFGEGYRFRSIGGTGNQATFMKSVKHVPIEPLPSAVVVMQGQIQKCQDGIIAVSYTHLDVYKRQSSWC